MKEKKEREDRINGSPKESIIDLLEDLGDDLRSAELRSPLRAFLSLATDNGFQLLALYRIAHFLSGTRASFAIAPVKWLQYVLTGSEVNHLSVIGRRVRFPHPTGIIIGAGAVVEDDVTIFQQVTLGSHGRPGQPKQYPRVREGAVIYAGARIIGGVVIGKRAVVGANSVVVDDVQDDTIVTGNPARA